MSERKNNARYLVGVPGVSMQLLVGEPLELDYTEECITGDYLALSERTGVFFDQATKRYLLLKDGKAQAKQEDWKPTLEEVQEGTKKETGMI